MKPLSPQFEMNWHGSGINHIFQAVSNNGFSNRWGDKLGWQGVPTSPLAEQHLEPDTQARVKLPLPLHLPFLGKHFPLPVQKLIAATPHHKKKKKNTPPHIPIYPFMRYFKYLHLIMTFHFNITRLFPYEQDIGCSSFFPPMNKSVAVPSNRNNSMILILWSWEMSFLLEIFLSPRRYL